ncbi:MAG: S8 family serine peptidase [Micromonosporaceae bacterium]
MTVQPQPALAQQPEAVTVPPHATVRADSPPRSGLWLVQLEEPSLATYRGGRPGLAATSPLVTGARTLDVTSPRSRAYLGHLADRQAEVTARMERVLGRTPQVVYAYRNVVNALAVRVDAEEAARLAELPGVASVTPDEELRLDTDVSHDLIGSAAVWDGDTGPGLATRGEGVIVGLLDTGVNPDHPSFAAVDGDGYRHTNPFGPGTYVGVCDPAHPQHEDICNDKLIGAWNFALFSSSAVDDNGHGSHVASTMAGNRHEAVFTVGNDQYTRTIQGVAPRANIISYRVCDPSCFTSATVAAVEQAITDGVDVLNFSISGPDNPWGNIVDQAFLEAFAAGVFIAASAGNDGPGAGTVAKTAPWNAAVAATNTVRLIAQRLDVVDPAAPPELIGLAAVPGEGPQVQTAVEAPVRYAGAVDDGNDNGCAPFPGGVFEGAVALVRRGDCNFSVKVDNAAAAGAIATVVFNQFAGPAFVMGGLEATTIPALMVTRDDGERLAAFLATHPDAVVRIDTETVVVGDEEWASVVADFSSRGPSRFDLLAPTFAAPGRGILAAGAAVGDDPLQYRFMQGTSMASPHGAGAGALLKALHPDWSPAQIRSALATTADRTGLVKEDGVTPADPFDVGSGLLDLSRAAAVGVVLDETYDNFVQADPATGGDPKALNLPAMVDHNCDQVCSFTRRLTSVADVTATYTATTEAPEGMVVTVTPAEFTLAPGATQELTVTVDVSDLVGGDWVFAGVDLVTDAAHASGTPVAGVHLPVAVIPAEPVLTVEPEELSSVQDVAQTVTQEVTIGNAGGAQMQWQLVTDADGCDAPDHTSWVDVAPRSGSLAPGDEQALAVTFDSTGMVGGVYTATLCVGSNDPHRPLATVALTLEVVEIPVVAVDPGALAVTQPAGTTTSHSLSIANTGHGVLTWSLAEEDAGPSEERVQLLRDGVLLVPNSATANRGVMAFDPHTGDLIDPEFIPHFPFDPSTTLYTPKHLLVKPDGSGFLMTDQVRWVITEYDLEGNFRKVFAPVSGERQPELMGNLRGMAWSPWGTLLVTVASGDNANSIVELDADGNFLGTFIEPGFGGLNSPWYLLFREQDLLVSASGSSGIHRYSHDGTQYLGRFADLNWPAQMVELDNGNILTVNWSGTGGAGVREFDADGNLVGSYVAAGSSYAGVWELGNGNILTTTSTGVYEIDRAGEVMNTKFDGGRARYVTPVRMPGLLPCATPDEVPWLSVSQEAGQTVAGQRSEVTVLLDSTGLAAGTHEAQLCVTSDDPDTPLVPVRVTLTVTGPACDRTVTGTHAGALRVDTGLTCLAAGARVTGAVVVGGGGGLFASDATVNGPVTASGAAMVEIYDSTVRGGVSVRGGTGSAVLSGNDITGVVWLSGNNTGDTPIVVAGNTITGRLACDGNEPPPVNDGRPNEVTGPRTGQCADL